MILPLQELQLAPSGAATPDSRELPADGLVMRVHGSMNTGKLVRISSRKCTVGCARSCTLRLVSKTFQPVHCLILRGSKGTVVRCWSHRDTQLNGASFDDDWLRPGDRLRIGKIELEIVSDRLPCSDAKIDSDRLSSEFHVTAKTKDERVKIRRHYRRRIHRLCHQLRDTRRSVQKLAEVDAYREQQIAHLQSVITRLSRSSLEATAVTCEDRLDDRLRRLMEQLVEWEMQADENQIAWVKHFRQVVQLLHSTQGSLEECQLAEWIDRCGSQMEIPGSMVKSDLTLREWQSQLDARSCQVVDPQQHSGEQEHQLKQSWLEQEEELRSKIAELEPEVVVEDPQYQTPQETHLQALNTKRPPLVCEPDELRDSAGELQDAAQVEPSENDRVGLDPLGRDLHAVQPSSDDEQLQGDDSLRAGHDEGTKELDQLRLPLTDLTCQDPSLQEEVTEQISFHDNGPSKMETADVGHPLTDRK